MEITPDYHHENFRIKKSSQINVDWLRWTNYFMQLSRSYNNMKKKDQIQTLTTTDKILKPFHEFFTWAAGDPESSTFETRKTIFELLLGVFGFLVVKKISDSIDF